MAVTDYYVTSVTENIAYNLGRSTQIVATSVSSFNPFKAVGTVMIVWGAMAGIINYRKYKKGKITKKQAIAITAGESVGMGLSAGLGLLADGIFIATAVPSTMAFTMGVVVTSGAKIAWNCATNNNEVWCTNKTTEQARANKTRYAN